MHLGVDVTLGKEKFASHQHCSQAKDLSGNSVATCELHFDRSNVFAVSVGKTGALGKARPVHCELSWLKWNKKKCDEALHYGLGISLYLNIFHYYMCFFCFFILKQP